jgi:hypothetical protein
MKKSKYPLRSCFKCFNLKQRGKGLIGCSLKGFEKIYYPEFRRSLVADFRHNAKNCEHYEL